MGLAFTESDAQWSYGGFNNFRRRLANSIGLNLDAMVGFGGDIPWSAVKDDIKWFLNHSDCEGSIGPSRCAKIAPRIRAIVKQWPDEVYDHDKSCALKLAKDMERLGKEGKRLNFC